MIINYFTNTFILICTISAVVPALYYFSLCSMYFISRKKTSSLASTNKSKIVILIPAHNEEYTINKTLNSCVSIDYPKDLYDIYVILDNCEDSTKKIVSENGIQYLERIDPNNRGKGFALEWAFNQIEHIAYDAVMIVDADCEVSNNCLSSVDFYLQQDYQALQLNDISSNPDASPLSYILSIGNFIENEYFYYPKNKLNLAIQCRGTGMVFTKKLLKNIPWKASSITEDMEYSINLFRNNINVYFIKEAYVKSEFPDTEEKFIIQRSRWAQGNLGFTKSKAYGLILEGIKNKSTLLIDAGITLYILSKPLVILLVLSSLLLSAIAYVIYPGHLLLYLLIINILSLGMLIIYFSSAIIFYGLSFNRLKYLIHVPRTLYQLVKVSVKGIHNSNDGDNWNKTPRL